MDSYFNIIDFLLPFYFTHFILLIFVLHISLTNFHCSNFSVLRISIFQIQSATHPTQKQSTYFNLSSYFSYFSLLIFIILIIIHYFIFISPIFISLVYLFIYLFIYSFIYSFILFYCIDLVTNPSELEVVDILQLIDWLEYYEAQMEQFGFNHSQLSSLKLFNSMGDDLLR